MRSLENLLQYRIALWGFLFFATGVASARHYVPSTEAFANLTVALVASVIVLLALWRYFGAALKLGALSLTLFAIGFAIEVWPQLSFSKSEIHRLALFAPRNVVITGEILTATEHHSTGHSWIVKAEQVEVDSHHANVQGVVRLFVSDGPAGVNFTELRPGDRVKAYVELEALKPPSNPHEFASDEFRQRTQGIEAYARAASMFDLYALDRRRTAQAGALDIFRDRAREWVKETISNSLKDDKASAFAIAVVLGERSALSASERETFTRAGVSHILAISGFNVALVAVLLVQLLRFLGLRRRAVRIVLSMILIFLYVWLVGWEPSVVRSLVMIECFFFAQFLERKADAANLLAATALITILIMPFDLFNPGFQLSYAAVFAMVAVYPTLEAALLGEGESEQQLLHRLITATVRMTLLTLVVTAATLPITAFHFNRISLSGIVANIPVVPLSALATTLSILLLPIAAVSHWLADIYGEVVVGLLQAIVALAGTSSRLPGAGIVVPSPNGLGLSLIALLVLYVLLATDRANLVARSSLALVACLLLLIVPIRLSASSLLPEGKLSILFFDVGQGDAALIRTQGGRTAIIDFGGVSPTGYSRAEQTIVPFLRAEGLDNDVTAIVSHIHRDHYGGAVSLLGAVNAREILTSGGRTHDPFARTLDSIVHAERIPVRQVAAGDVIELDSATRLLVLSPSRMEQIHPYATDDNERSLVLKLIHGSTSVLFTGDIPSTTEHAIVRRYGAMLESNVVKVPHHGSRSSSSREFIAASAPNFAIFSLGARNRFGHPAREVVGSWRSSGATIYRTDRHGAQLFVSDGKQIMQTPWR